MTKSLATQSIKSIQKTVNSLATGKSFLPVPSHNKPPNGPTAANMWAFALLENSLYEMSGYERRFAADLTERAALTDKQRSFLKKTVVLHLGIDIDEQEEPEADNDNVKPASNKKAA